MKAEYKGTLWLSSSTTYAFSYPYSSQNTHKNVHSSTVCNSPRLKTPQMPISNRTNKYGIFTKWNTVQQWEQKNDIFIPGWTPQTMLSERSQVGKEYIMYDLSMFKYSQNLPMVLKIRIVAALAGAVTRSRNKGSVLGVSNILILDLGAGFIGMFNFW